MPKCWMLSNPSPRPCIVSLGRNGDLMILMPGLKRLYDSTGVKPVVVVSKEFSNIFEGVSYAEAHPVAFNVYHGVKQAIALAIATYGDCIVPKWWDDPRNTPPPKVPVPWFPDGTQRTVSDYEKVTLMYEGRKWVMFKEDWDNYMVSQWEHAGFTRKQLLEWPLVFDRRVPSREQTLIKQYFKTDKPKLLYNFGGITSPLPAEARGSMQQIIAKMSQRFETVNLAMVQGQRIFDLLGLYDKAAALLTTDTATLHLAAASSVKYVALLANGGSGSVPKGNCLLAVRYANIQKQVQDIEQTLNSL